jgi:hypothetical protein
MSDKKEAEGCPCVACDRLARLEAMLPDLDFDAYETVDARWLAVLAAVADLRRTFDRSEHRRRVLEKRLADVKDVAAGRLDVGPNEETAAEPEEGTDR